MALGPWIIITVLKETATRSECSVCTVRHLDTHSANTIKVNKYTSVFIKKNDVCDFLFAS